MAKRARRHLNEELAEEKELPSKKRKIDQQTPSYLQDFIKATISNVTSGFATKHTSNHLSLIINDYISLNNYPNYPYIFLSSQNKWKHKNKLKKSERIQYLLEQIIHPLQHLAQGFNTNSSETNPIHYEYFLNGISTSQTKWSKYRKSWVSSHISKPKKPLYWSNNTTFISRSFHSICHFIQKESGTGVHIGNGYILSCAHVIVCDFDDDSFDIFIDRIGRIKYVIFANGILYKAKCVAFDDKSDLALLKINFDSVINIVKKKVEKDDKLEIGSAVLCENMPELQCELFCVGNPSNINLEMDIDEDNDFEPKIFHLSFGKLEMENDINDELGGYGHSAWTYWGHSGAPLFNESGEIIGLHNSWNDQTGLRQAVTLKNIKRFVALNCKNAT